MSIGNTRIELAKIDYRVIKDVQSRRMGFIEEARKKAQEAEMQSRMRQEAWSKELDRQNKLIKEYKDRCGISYVNSITNMNLSPFPRLIDEFWRVAPGVKRMTTDRFTTHLDTFDYPGSKMHECDAVAVELKWDYSDSEGAAKGTYKEIDIIFYGDGKIIVQGDRRGTTTMAREDWYQKPENAETVLEKAFKNPQRMGWDRSGYSEAAGPGL